MGLVGASLGTKLNLALLLFALILGISMAVLIFYGFDRTQTNATAHSREGLEDSGQTYIQYLASAQASSGVLQMEYASQLGQEAARYLIEFKNSGGSFHSTARVW
jgi:hypothetical protein